MLRSLLTFSLQNRIAVVVGAAVLIVAGAIGTLRTPLDVFPEFAPPRVEVQVEAPGLSSEAVEQLVTLPLESALNGVPRLTTIRSKSVQGLASVDLFFEYGSDPFQARQIVSENVALVSSRLPQQARTPRVMPILSSTSRVLKLGLTPKKKDGQPLCTQTDISVLMRWTIEPALFSVPGVANVSTYGLQDLQYHVLVDPRKLRAKGVTLDQVKLAVRQGVVYGSAGYHDTPNQRLAVQYATPVKRPRDLEKIVVTPASGGSTDQANPPAPVPAPSPGPALLLRDVARVSAGNPQPVGDGVINDEAGLLVVVEKYPWANTLEVTRAVEKKHDELRPGLPNVEMTTTIFRPATFIELALGNLRVAVLIGCGLVALIVIAFLFEWRTAVISLTAIPLSLVAAVVVLTRLGATLNTMVLAGLAIAVGEVVDDAIIDVENIVRRLRLNAQLPNPRSAFRVVLDASLEVRSAVVYASFIVMFVCLPIFFLGGVAGAFFRPLATAYILAVFASLLVALTVTPALALLLLPGSVTKHRDRPVTRAVRWLYRGMLHFDVRGLLLP